MLEQQLDRLQSVLLHGVVEGGLVLDVAGVHVHAAVQQEANQLCRRKGNAKHSHFRREWGKIFDAAKQGSSSSNNNSYNNNFYYFSSYHSNSSSYNSNHRNSSYSNCNYSRSSRSITTEARATPTTRTSHLGSARN